MNTNYREQLHNCVPADIYDYFNSLLHRITSNGNEADAKFLSFDSSEPPCPVSEGQFTRLKLTDGSCTLTSFNDSFIKLRIKSELNLNFKLYGGIDPHFESALQEISGFLGFEPCFYVGFKSGIHAIEHYRFYSDRNPTYLSEQSQAIYESTLTYFTKSNEEIDSKCGAYASIDDIKQLKREVPGQYITWSEVYTAYYDKKAIPIDFEVIIKYDDFAPLQFFNIYPNEIVGNMKIEFKISSLKNFVIAQVPFSSALNEYANKSLSHIKIPLYDENTTDKRYKAYADTMGLKDCCTFNNINKAITYPFPIKGYETMTYDDLHDGSSEDAVSKYRDYVYFKLSSVEITPVLKPLTLTSCRSYIHGYNIKREKVNELRELLTNNKLYIPAQRIDHYSFSQIPTENILDCNTIQNLINCSSIIFTFPRDEHDLTCSFNPYCETVQLKIDNKIIPDKPFSTYSLEYKNYILSSLMFDDFFTPNKSLLNSLNNNNYSYDNISTGLGRLFISKECSNYLLHFSLESINSDPFVFDGITKDSCYISLIGTFMKRPNGSDYMIWDNDVDMTEVFYSLNSNKQPPIMYLCQDTLWELSSEGIKYYYNNKSIISEISK